MYALPVLFLVYVLDLYEREPLSLVIGALLWGAVAATTLAGFANDGWGLVVSRVGGPEFAARWTAALTAPFVEEILKGLGVVLIYLIAPDEFDDMMDGFVYGAVCGLGFAVVEDVFYFMGVFGGHPNGVLQGFFVRVVSSGLYSHVLYTGLVGMGIGYFVSRRTRRPLARRIMVLAGLSAAAVLGHFLWNSPFLDLFPARPWSGADLAMIPVATAVKGLPLLAFATLAVVVGPQTRAHVAARRARGRDRRSRASPRSSSRRSRTRACGAGRSAACGRVPGATPPAPPPAPARTGEPGDDPLEGRRRRRPGVDRAARVLRIAPRRAPCDPGRGPRRRGGPSCRRGCRRPLGFGRWMSER